MADTNNTTTFQPPYMSWTTFDGILENFRAAGMPEQIDRSVLRGKSGGDQAQFLRAAHAFGLIGEDGTPTDRMRALVLEPERRPEILREILTECYPEVVALGASATAQQLHDRFRALGIEGADTLRKAEAFYLNAARIAEIQLSSYFPSTRPGAGGRRTGTRRKPAAKQSPPSGNDAEKVTPPRDPLAGLHPAIVTLVQSLPSFEGVEGKPEFSTVERKAWFAYAQATFNLIYALPDGDSGEAD